MCSSDLDPDATVSDGEDTFNIFNGDTVDGSAGATEGTDGQGGSGFDEPPDESEGSASASADCNDPPTCSGDAVQCALLRQEFNTGCQDIPGESQLLADLGLTGLDDPSTALGSDSFDLSDDLDLSGFGSGGACVAAIPIILGGIFGTVDVDISLWCGLFEMIGLLMLISASVISLRIIAGGF